MPARVGKTEETRKTNISKTLLYFTHTQTYTTSDLTLDLRNRKKPNEKSINVLEERKAQSWLLFLVIYLIIST